MLITMNGYTKAVQICGERTQNRAILRSFTTDFREKEKLLAFISRLPGEGHLSNKNIYHKCWPSVY